MPETDSDPVTGLEAAIPAYTEAIPPGTLGLSAAGKSAVIKHGNRTQPYIALTFDACHSSGRPTGYDEAVIQVLTGTNTPATLFLSGLWVQRHQAQVQELAHNPLFELANHAWSHPHFGTLTPREINKEVERTQQIMVTLTGRSPKLFRFPYDIATNESMRILRLHDLHAISGDIISGDPDPTISTQEIVREVVSQAQNGSIIIMHMNKRGWHTAEALPVIIRRLRNHGYTFVTVSQLLEIESKLASDDSEVSDKVLPPE